MICSIFVIDDTVQEGTESVIAMIPDVTHDDPVYRTIYKLRPIVISLTDVSQSIHDTTAVSATISLGPQLNNKPITVTKLQGSDGFSIGVAVSDLDGYQCRMLAHNIMESLRYLFGKLSVSDLIQNLDDIKLCLRTYKLALDAPNNLSVTKSAILFDGLAVVAKLSLMTSKRLCSELSRLQASQATNDSAFSLLPRSCFPVGSCFFRRGICIYTSMSPIDLLDTARYCLLNHLLSRTENDGLIVQLKRIFSSCFEKRVISVVAWGHSMICMLFHCSNETTSDGHIDPYHIAEMRSFLHNMDTELSEQIDDDVSQLDRLTVSISDLPSKLVHKQSNNENHEQHVVVPPKPTKAPSSPRIRRKAVGKSTHEQKDVKADRRLGFVGVETQILRFRIVDRYCKSVTEAPFVSSSPLDIQIAAFFTKAVANLQHKLRGCSPSPKAQIKADERVVKQPIVKVKGKQESGEAENFRYSARSNGGSFSVMSKASAEECAFHFQIKWDLEDEKSNAVQQMGFIVVGALLPPHHEVYLCVEDSTPKNILNLAFQLAFAWT